MVALPAQRRQRSAGLDLPCAPEPAIAVIGCDIPDWFGRFLVRLSSTTRLSKDDRPFFFIGRPETFEGPLSTFFTTYCPLIQHLDMTRPPS